ncbi:helix-turn-helix transcriptional regulator [Lachnospiraceae bacterium 54-11]
MSIGENIKNRRKSVGVSQNALASAVGVSTPMICQIERGTKSVTLRLAVDIAKVLRCDINDFLSEKEE